MLAAIYIRGEFYNEACNLQAAVSMRRKGGGADREERVGVGLGFSICIPGCIAGAYICGEETALLESPEGKKGMPRLKPPFPAAVGVLDASSTTVNIAESTAAASRFCGAGGVVLEKAKGPKNVVVDETVLALSAPQ